MTQEQREELKRLAEAKRLLSDAAAILDSGITPFIVERIESFLRGEEKTH